MGAGCGQVPFKGLKDCWILGGDVVHVAIYLSPSLTLSSMTRALLRFCGWMVYKVIMSDVGQSGTVNEQNSGVSVVFYLI